MKYDPALSRVCWERSAGRCNRRATLRRGAEGVIFKVSPEKILLLYHCVDPADSQTDTEQGRSALI